MAEAKTKPTQIAVEDHLAAKASAEQLADCKALMALLQKVTMALPKMWGPSIVGYGSYRYTYESGRTGESCLTGFAVRGSAQVHRAPSRKASTLSSRAAQSDSLWPVPWITGAIASVAV